MDKAKQILKKILKIAIKHLARILMPVIAVICIIVVIFAGGAYILDILRGTFKQGDWGNVPYATSQYIGGVTINENGQIVPNMTAQQLWDRLVEENSEVEEYLDGPEELARLMKAEMITQYPDLRPNPDEEINWEELYKDADKIQGIIKFKRAKADGNTSTMSYVDKQTFQSYIDEYNQTGSESAKNKALSHFTLNTTSGGGSGQLQTIDGVNMQVIEDNGKITFYNGDGSKMEGGSSNALDWALDDGQCAAKGLREKAPYRSVIYIETKESGEGSFANGKFFYVTDTGGGLADNQVDVYARVSQHDLNRAPYGSTTGAKISLVEKNVTWKEYLQKYHNKTLNKSGTETASDNSNSGGNKANSNSSPGDQIVDYAKKWIGHPYKDGGDSLEHGIDCSHFVWRVLKNSIGYKGGYTTSTNWKNRRKSSTRRNIKCSSRGCCSL